MTIADLLRQHARYRPTQEAVVERTGSITYGMLDRMVDGLCHGLRRQGVTAGSLVGLSLDDDGHHLAVLLALGRLGAVILPLDRRWNVNEKIAVAERFAADVVLVDEDAGGRPGWLHPTADWFAPSDEPYRDETVTDDSPMVLSLSSGTTGLPKGPRLTHRQFISRLMVYWIDIGLGSRDRFVVGTPLFFGGGRAFALAMIHAGGTACLFPPPYDPRELAEFVKRVRGTSMFLVPTLLRRLLEAGLEAPAFPTVKALISSGSALYAGEAAAVREKLTPNLYQYYASTEAGGVSLLTPEGFEIHPDSVGRPCFGVDVEVVGGEDHRRLAAGEVGELRYRSPASPARYHLGDAATAFRDGWFYPGDLATMDADGYLYLRGRVKDMIIRGGVNIYPGDIERVLLDQPEVAEAAVVGSPSPELGEEIAAFVVCRTPIAASRLTQICGERLARYKVPKTIIFVDDIPKNAAGKVLKADLVQLLQPAGRSEP